MTIQEQFNEFYQGAFQDCKNSILCNSEDIPEDREEIRDSLSVMLLSIQDMIEYLD